MIGSGFTLLHLRWFRALSFGLFGFANSFQHLLVGSEIERLSGYSQTRLLLSDDGHAGSHAGEELLVRIGGINDDGIGHHVACGGRFHADLVHGAFKHIVHVGIDSESHALSHFHLPNVGFVDVGFHLHLGQVVGQGEQSRRAERGSYGLAHFHGTVKDDAIDRRIDFGIAQIHHSLVVGGLRVSFAHLGLGVGVLRLLIGCQRCGIRFIKLFCTFVGEFGIIELALGRGKAGLGTTQALVECLLVQFGHQLTFLHHIVEIDIDFFHLTRYLRTDFDGLHRLDGARRGDRVLNGVLRDHMGTNNQFLVR